MLHTTRAIVLRSVRHRDNGVVLTLFTEAHGTRAYLVRVGGKSGVPQALLGPLQRLMVVANERADRELGSLREARADRSVAFSSTDAVRSAMLLFAQEVLVACLRESPADPELFAHLCETLDDLCTTNDPAHAPLRFLVDLCPYLGFAPEHPINDAAWFDLQDGRFCQHEPPHPHAFTGTELALLTALLKENDRAVALRSNAVVRRALMGHLVHYYRLHVAGFGELRSPAVLQAAFG